MKYLLLIYGDERALGDDERQRCYGESTRLMHELKAHGQFLATAPLHDTPTATSVRVRGGTRLVTDGPFAETKEQLGGFFLVEVQDREEALGIAARIPGAARGTVEVRPVVELPNVPSL